MPGRRYDDASREPPNTLLVGGRFRLERERLGLSLADLSRLMEMGEQGLADWEASTASEMARGLTLFGYAGADILFIVTGVRNRVDPHNGRSAQDVFRHALDQLSGADRQRLLLHLVAEEVR